MGLVALLILFAIFFGGVGIAQGLWWLIVIAVLLALFGGFSGNRFRR